MTAQRLPVVPGLALPFYPARPMLGAALQTPTQALAQLDRSVAEGYVVQPKLNGDRACLAMTAAGELVVQNRHGGWLHQKVKNLAVFETLLPGTCLDGEVLPGGVFTPFECLALAGESLVAAPTAERVEGAGYICAKLGLPWQFDLGSRKTFARLRQNLPTCEGYVAKAPEAYPIGTSATAETTQWIKFKW